MKAIKISTFPLIQAAFRSNERVKKKSDTTNTAEKTENPRISQKDAVFGENLRWKTQ